MSKAFATMGLSLWDGDYTVGGEVTSATISQINDFMHYLIDNHGPVTNTFTLIAATDVENERETWLYRENSLAFYFTALSMLGGEEHRNWVLRVLDALVEEVMKVTQRESYAEEMILFVLEGFVEQGKFEAKFDVKGNTVFFSIESGEQVDEMIAEVKRLSLMYTLTESKV